MTYDPSDEAIKAACAAYQSVPGKLSLHDALRAAIIAAHKVDDEYRPMTDSELRTMIDAIMAPMRRFARERTAAGDEAQMRDAAE